MQVRTVTPESKQKQLQILYHQREVAREKMREAQVLDQGFKSDFWKKLRKWVEQRKIIIDSDLEGFKKLSESETKCLLQAQADFKYFLNLDKNFERNQTIFSRKLSEIEERIEALKGGK